MLCPCSHFLMCPYDHRDITSSYPANPRASSPVPMEAYSCLRPLVSVEVDLIHVHLCPWGPIHVHLYHLSSCHPATNISFSHWTQFLLASLSRWRCGLSLLITPAFVCLPVVAFLVAFNQNKALIGDRGLLPCRLYLKNVQQYFHGSTGWSPWTYTPTIMWLLDWSDMNFNLDLLALLGLGLSSFVLVTGCANMILMAALWALYMSLVNVGQIW